jgi:hypothetical protein
MLMLVRGGACGIVQGWKMCKALYFNGFSGPPPKPPIAVPDVRPMHRS